MKNLAHSIAQRLFNRSNLTIPVGHLPEVAKEISQQLSPVLSRLGIK